MYYPEMAILDVKLPLKAIKDYLIDKYKFKEYFQVKAVGKSNA